MTDDAWTGVLGYAVIYLPFAALMIGSFLYLVFRAKRAEIEDFYPMGDASDTPAVRHNTRRVNFKREEV